MKWAAEYLFYDAYRIESESPTRGSSLQFAKGSVFLMIAFIPMTLAILIDRTIHFDLFGFVADFWPEINPKIKLLRKTDGLAILIGVLTICWIHWKLGKPERYLPIIHRFENKKSNDFEKNKIFSISLFLSGIALVGFTLFELYLLSSLVVIFLLYANYRIYVEFYKT